MQAELTELLLFRVYAEQEALGHVTDVYFDDAGWRVRYLAVTSEAGNSGLRQFLLAPEAIGGIDRHRGLISVVSRQAAVYSRPVVAAARNISRQEEGRVRAHYGLPNYWPNAATPETDVRAPAAVRTHLHRLGAVLGYRVVVGQDDIGSLINLAMEDGTWEIQNLEVDASNWLPAGRIWVRAACIQWMRELEHEIVLTMPRAAAVQRPNAGLRAQGGTSQQPLAYAS